MVTDKRSITNLHGSGSVSNKRKSTTLAFFLTRFVVCCILISATNHALAEEGNNDISPDLETTDNENKSEDTPQIPASLIKQRQAQAALAETVDSDELIWLNTLYPGAEEQEQTLALKQEVKNPSSQGAILILPDLQQHADWPGVVRELRTRLPYDGWFTLSINLPWPMLEKAPQREQQTKQKESYAPSAEIQAKLAMGSRPFRKQADMTDESVEQESSGDADGDNVDINLTAESEAKDPKTVFLEQAIVHLQAGFDKLEELGFQNIVLLATGSSAEIAVEYVESRVADIGDSGFSLVMVAPRFDEGNDPKFGERLGEEFPAPVLDIYDATSRSSSEKARARLISTQVAQFANYHSVKLPLARSSSFQQTLSKRLKDWLEKHAPGEKKGG